MTLCQLALVSLMFFDDAKTVTNFIESMPDFSAIVITLLLYGYLLSYLVITVVVGYDPKLVVLKVAYAIPTIIVYSLILSSLIYLIVRKFTSKTGTSRKN
jgi:membrane protein implicated in regulation of membrane protease activity